MKTGIKKELAIAGTLALVGVTLVAIRNNLGPAQMNSILEPGVAPIENSDDAQAETSGPSAPPSLVAPLIVKDTDTDSPGTNIVTRIVTFTAKVAGTSPVALQWEVDQGSGFVVIAGATNDTFRIGNAQVADSGFYSLFAANSAGHIRTTPVPLIVTEGED